MLKATTAALHKLPALIQGAGKAIKGGVDIGEPFAEWWSKAKRHLRHAIINQIRDFGEALEEAGKRAEKYVSAKPSEATRQRDPDIVAAEAEVRRMLLSGDTPPSDLAAKVQILDLRGTSDAPNHIARPEDLALLINLHNLATWRPTEPT